MLSKTYRTLRAVCSCWLRYQKQCPVIIFERSNVCSSWRPDILAITNTRNAIEVEIKVSLSDFKRDGKKKIWRLRKMGEEEIERGGRWAWLIIPKYFYYLVPPELVEKVKDLELGDKGLITLDLEHTDFYSKLPVLKFIKKAKANKNASKMDY